MILSLTVFDVFSVWSRLNERYQELYHHTKDKLVAMPKGKQFDFNEAQIFSRHVGSKTARD